MSTLLSMDTWPRLSVLLTFIWHPGRQMQVLLAFSLAHVFIEKVYTFFVLPVFVFLFFDFLTLFIVKKMSRSIHCDACCKYGYYIHGLSIIEVNARNRLYGKCKKVSSVLCLEILGTFKLNGNISRIKADLCLKSFWLHR